MQIDYPEGRESSRVPRNGSLASMYLTGCAPFDSGDPGVLQMNVRRCLETRTGGGLVRGTLKQALPHLFEDSRMSYTSILIKIDFLESRESAASPNIYFYFRNIPP